MAARTWCCRSGACDELLGTSVEGVRHVGIDRVMADPSSFGFSNVDDACIMPDTPPFTCRQPNSYFFWDGLHATMAGASVFAREAALQLGLD